MRCIICDFNPECGSIYHSGLSEGCSKNLKFSEELGGHVCDSCEYVDYVMDEEDDKFVLDTAEE